MSGGAHQFDAGWEGDEDGESDFFSEFFGPLSSEFPAKLNNNKSAAAAPHHKNNSNDRAGDGGAAVNEEEVESSGNRFGDHGKRRGACTSGGSKGKEEAGASCDSHHKRKRKRTTEMHNMTERRRRDKIKGKLKALQELVPNSHKLDRASLLDEAVAYLKSLQMHVNTLQMQVQMMSGGGLCHMPPLPGACLHMSAFSHFSPMDPIGAYGMGMASMGCPVGPPLMSLPSPNMVPLAGFGTIRSFGPPSQGVPFPLIPEFTVATSSPIPSPPILQAGPFSLHSAEAGSQETVAAQVHPGWMIARK